MCHLHLEAKCFSGKKGLTLSLADTETLTNPDNPDAQQPQPSDHDYCVEVSLPTQQQEQQPTDHDYCARDISPPTQQQKQQPSDHDYCAGDVSPPTQQPVDHGGDTLDISANTESDATLQIEELKRQLQAMKNLKIKSENNLRVKNFRLKRKCDNLNSTIGDLNIKLDLLHKKFEIESSFVEKLKNCVSEVPNEIFQATVKRIEGGRVRSYHPALKKFALSLHSCSAKAYR